MEGDVARIADRPKSDSNTSTSAEHVRKEQEKWDAWKSNESLSRTEAKRRYIAKLIDTMHRYASTTPEARELVEELEFVWDQIKNNTSSSHNQSSGSDHSSPLQNVERSGYLQSGSSGAVASSAAALEGAAEGGTGAGNGAARPQPMRMLSPVSQADEDEVLEEEREEFVDAPVSQVDEADLQDLSEMGEGAEHMADAAVQATEPRKMVQSQGDARWRRKIESSLVKLTTEVAALREILEFRRYDKKRRTLFGWVLQLSWWAVQLVIADAVVLWFVILYLRRKDDRRLEGAIRVLLGDAVAQVQKVGSQVRRIGVPKPGSKE